MSLCPCCHRGTSGPGVTRTGLEAPLAPARDRGTQGGGCRSSSTPGLHSSAVVLLQAASLTRWAQVGLRWQTVVVQAFWFPNPIGRRQPFSTQNSTSLPSRLFGD
eukprot:CAMPEP_0174343460 /NCGR_PEP_ID=MMETSP0810-20121108/26975_1 /TAXON_ID=73025 ORGANISM="Eutreptiella gymnastica-like, Strain CCMP1594" /NCGR_SAMPLE_ID=MMETSP0810 /ASSEMBLY_ACC=CAM_ASM_000659 /LENGTH=104 /DNA_ID=CAMNT_0015466201 /DNA_START=2655 /DNA_END=2970 /DNA_ORIENTATION=-